MSSRDRLSDLLQNYAFWLVDVSPTLTTFPIFALQPVYQFATASAPGVTLTEREIQQCNQMLPTKVVESASVETITLTRGAQVGDGDFWRWIRQSLHGHENTNKTLLLIQFINVNPNKLGGAGSGIAGTAAAIGLVGGAGLALGLTTALGAISGAMTSEQNGKATWVPRVPVRAWLLYRCKPIRYKPASDFDAMSSDISIMELDVSMESFEEISLL